MKETHITQSRGPGGKDEVVEDEVAKDEMDVAVAKKVLEKVGLS